MFDQLFLESQKAGANLALPFLYDINSQFNITNWKIEFKLNSNFKINCNVF